MQVSLRFRPLLATGCRLRLSAPSVARLYSSQRSDNNDDAAVAQARKWLDNFNPDTIPRNICEITFSRSSGPGGQNVNKVNSKATLRVPLNSLVPIVPPLILPEIRASRYYAAKSDSLILQADDSRKQSDNSAAAHARLCTFIQELGKKAVPGETSDAQKQRVKRLQASQNEGRLKEKKRDSQKKGARRGKGGSSDY